MVPCGGRCQRVAQRLPTSGKPLRPFKEPTPQQQRQGKGSSHAPRFKDWHTFIRVRVPGLRPREDDPREGIGPREAPIPSFFFSARPLPSPSFDPCCAYQTCAVHTRYVQPLWGVFRARKGPHWCSGPPKPLSRARKWPYWCSGTWNPEDGGTGNRRMKGNYLLSLKKSSMSWTHSSWRMPPTASVRGWRREGVKRE